MKVLAMNTVFRLPDGFDGDLNAALRELIAYREAKQLTNIADARPDLPHPPHPPEAWRNEVWTGFLAALEQGYRHVGSGTIADVEDWPRPTPPLPAPDGTPRLLED